MVLVPLLLLLLASATAQMDPKALRPCFERYPNYRLVSLKPYHSEWRMRTEESCLQFCSDTRSRCRSIVYDSVQHICHFFLDDGNDFAIPAAKMIYLRVTSRDCLDPGHASGEVSYMDINSREKDMAPPMPMPTPMSMPPMAPMPTVPPGQFIIPATPTESFETTTETPASDTSLEMDMDMFDDFTTPASPFDEAIFGNAEEDIELERLQRKNELMRDINGLENQNKRWQSSMEQLVKNTDEFAFKGTRVSPPVRAVKVLPPRVETSTATVHLATAHVKPTEVEPIIERSTTRAPTTTESVLLIKEKLLEKLDVLKQKYPSRYAQYLAEKEKRLGMDSFLSSRLSSNEDILTPIPVEPVETVKTIDNSLSIETVKAIDNTLSIDDAEVVVPMAPIRPKKHRRTKFSGKRIAFSDDHMFSRKIDGADIRRQQQSKLKQVSLSASTSPPFVNKARSFLDMVNNNERDRTHGVKNSVLVENQLDNSATVTVTGSDVTGCSKGDTPILMTFENSVGSSSIDSNFVENWEACRQMCQDENCRSFTYYDDKQCMINTEDEGVNLRPPTMGPYTAQTTLKFCYPDNVSPFHGCANFVGFRDYSLTVEPRELFEGLPPGYDGLKLCTELCVLSAEYSCRSASFEMLEGVCKLYAVDSISAPKSFELSNVQYQLYFENGCSAQPKLSLIAKDYVAIERVPMKDQSSRKALQMKPSKLKIHKLDRRRKNTSLGNL
uniref:Apple domain-containing protein n=1 Tax=Haemonchus contortus TaxID=6289 RepID=A0A7I4Y0R8_HAECO